jgi:naphthoate synthase
MAPSAELFDPTVWHEVSSVRSPTSPTSRDGPPKAYRVQSPEVRNAFRPQSVDENSYGGADHLMNTGIGVVLITGKPRARRLAGRCSAAHGIPRGPDYQYADGTASTGHLHILEVQRPHPHHTQRSSSRFGCRAAGPREGTLSRHLRP